MFVNEMILNPQTAVLRFTVPEVTLDEVREVPETVVQLPVVLAHALKETAPPAAPVRVYVQVMVPVAPALRFRLGGLGDGVGLFTLALVVVAVVRGEGTGAIAVRATLVLFVTLMVKVNWQPFPTLVGAGTRVMRRDFQVQELVVLFGVRQVVDPENRAFALLRPVV